VTELGIARAAPPAPEPPSDWQRYFLALSRHRWFVLAVTLAGTAIGATAAMTTEPGSASTMRRTRRVSGT